MRENKEIAANRQNWLNSTYIINNRNRKTPEVKVLT